MTTTQNMNDLPQNDLKRAVDSITDLETASFNRDRYNRHLGWLIIGGVSLAIVLGLSIGLGVGLTRDKASSSQTQSSNLTQRAGTKSSASPPPTWWQPTTNTTWNIALSTVPASYSPASTTQVYDLDVFDTPQARIASLKQAGHRVICYFSAGSYEDWRPDASSFPPAALGNPLAGWQGERWVNTSDAGVRAVMTGRINLAKSKGCDGVDPDNIDGYDNDSGLPLTRATAVDYIRFLTGAAHAQGLACGLKNGGAIVGQVLGLVDWEVNEQCAQYDECALFEPFMKAGKPVFQIEYTEQVPPPPAFVARTCGSRTPAGFSTLIKHMELGAWTARCPGGTVVPF